MGIRGDRRSAGGSLRNRLLVVLMVPLLAVAIATAGQVRDQVRIHSRAAHLQQFVTDISVIDAVRRGIEAEVVPSIAGAIRAATSAPAGGPASLSPSARESVRRVASEGGALRAGTDSALADAASVISDHSVTAQLARAKRGLAAARSGGTRAESASAAYARWAVLLVDMHGIEDSLVARADAIGLSSSGTRALGDVALITRAAQFAGQLVPSLVSTFLPGTAAETAANRARFLSGWGTYVTASAQVAGRTAAPLRTAWAAAERTPESMIVDRGMRSAAIDPQPNNSASLEPLGRAAQTRQQDLNAVLAAGLRRAEVVSEQIHASAERALIAIAIVDPLSLILTLGLVLLVRRWVSRSLTKLADQAQQVSEGELPDVDIGGPREVRTVARALAEAVTTLRGIQAQAGAAADGNLNSDALKTVLPGSLGQVVHASVARAFDAINDREVAQRELAHQAAHDPLTDLPNRGYAVGLISRSLHRAQRSNTMTGLMFVDLDHFKAVNDTFGHAAGDHVLKTVSRRMLDIVRDGDMVARLGGDEFVVLLEDITNETDFVRLADRVVAVLAEPIDFDGRRLRVGASVGVAVCRDGHVDGDRLMCEADAAAYRAKSGGRGRVDIFDDDLRRQLTEHAELEAALTDALANDEFVVFYQPVVDLTTGAAIGLEALIRWDRPGVGLVSPIDFIPVAEFSTLINDIGRFVLGAATRQLAVWTEQEPTTAHLTMAVNISGRHLTSPQLIGDVSEALSRSGIAADRLIIELTETMLVDDPRSTANMHALRALGVRIALDDFGTGYTSIGQLPKLPIDTLKIDRSFVSSTDPSYRELCKLMVSAARAFGLSVVAEGVETEGQADLLRHIHVQNCQGFLYATPQRAETLDPAALVRGQLAPDGCLGQLPLPIA